MANTAPPDPIPGRAQPTAYHARWSVPEWLRNLGGWSWRILVFGIVAYFTLDLLIALRSVVLAVIVALLATALLAPLKERLVRLRVPNLLASWLVLLFGVTVVAGLTVSASYFIGTELANTAQWEETGDEIRNWLQDGPADLSSAQVADLESRVRDGLASGVGGVNSDRARLLAEVVGSLLLAFVLTFFFVKDGAQIWTWVTRRVSSERRHAINDAGADAFVALRGYVRGVAATGVIDAVLVGGLLLLLGVPLAWPLGVLTFFAAFFPIVGATAVGSVGALVALVANGPRTAIIVAVGTLVIQQIEGDLIMPVIMKRTVNLHPVAVLLALATGGSIGGIAGAFIAVPLAATIAAAGRSLRSSAKQHGSQGLIVPTDSEPA